MSRVDLRHLPYVLFASTMRDESNDDGPISTGAESARGARHPIAFLRGANDNAPTLRRLGVVFDTLGQNGDNRTDIQRGEFIGMAQSIRGQVNNESFSVCGSDGAAIVSNGPALLI